MPASDPPPRYHVRFFIEAGVHCCLWAQDEATKDALGYAVHLDRLPLSGDLIADLTRLMIDFDHALAAHDPGGEVDTGPMVFGHEDDAPFRERVVALVVRLRAALGPDYLLETDFER
ncbi:MAG: hypothetical protein ABI740_06290 [Alphaproteobacteria bacterium]